MYEAGFAATPCAVQCEGRCGNYMVTTGNHSGLRVELLSILGILGTKKVTSNNMRFDRHDTL